jgi:hypothetical protein
MVSLLAPLLGLACRDRENIEHHPNESQGELSVPSLDGEANIEAPSLPLADEPLVSPLTEPSDSPLVSGPEVPQADQLPLADLMRLPESVTRSHADLATPGSDSDPQNEEERKAARLRVDVRRKRDAAEVDPDGSRVRERTDAGVSVDVGGDASVRGGVQVEREPGEEWRDPVPNVGVEKRF